MDRDFAILAEILRQRDAHRRDVAEFLAAQTPAEVRALDEEFATLRMEAVRGDEAEELEPVEGET